MSNKTLAEMAADVRAGGSPPSGYVYDGSKDEVRRMTDAELKAAEVDVIESKAAAKVADAEAQAEAEAETAAVNERIAVAKEAAKNAIP